MRLKFIIPYILAVAALWSQPSSPVQKLQVQGAGNQILSGATLTAVSGSTVDFSAATLLLRPLLGSMSITNGAALDALGAVATNGGLYRIASDTYAARTLTGTVGQIIVTNGDGIAGNPTILLPTALTGINTITSAPGQPLVFNANVENVGIGTTIPNVKLTVVRSGQAPADLSPAQWLASFTDNFVTGSIARVGIYAGSTGQAIVNFGAVADSDIGGIVYDNSDNSMSFRTNNAEWARIMGSGNILLGTSTDAANGRLQLASHTTSAGGLGFGTDLSLYRTAANRLNLMGSGSGETRLTISGGTALGSENAILRADCIIAGASGAASTQWRKGNNVADAKISDIVFLDGGILAFRYLNDAENAATTWLTATGTATAIASVAVKTGAGVTALTLDNTQNATFANSVKSSSATGGLGYATGAGGVVTQLTSKATGVTLNKVTGQITLDAASLAADTTVSFVLTNTTVAATDLLVLNHVSGGTAGAYALNAQSSAGATTINVRNLTAGALAEPIVIGFAVIKSVTN